jgi:phenylalanyl-tRNA synthetase beta chain
VDDDARTIERLLTDRGLTVDSVSLATDDQVLDVDIPANRPDCLGHLGLARELSAACGVPLVVGGEPRKTAGEDLHSIAQLFIDAPQLCRRFTARLVRGVEIGPSPDWVVRRLEACGLRSINNVVDASNLVMLETGNPIHFYDLERVSQATLRVRLAQTGERLTTLDGVERTLTPEMLVIADGTHALGLAGILGGADSEIGATTRQVLIEAAWFDPRSIRKTARTLGLKTDASFRFERGVDPEGLSGAQSMAVGLLSRLAGGTPAPGMIDVRPVARPPAKLQLRLTQLPRLLGYDPGDEAALEALRALSLDAVRLERDRIEVTVPSWRVDLTREVDLVEEVARHLGYDRIPTRTDGLPTILSPREDGDLERRSRDYLTGNGFHEALGYSMIADDEDRPFVDAGTPDALRLSNPITKTQSVLRRSISPGLLRAVDLNSRRGVRDVRLFEVGRVFLPESGRSLPHEPVRVGVVWGGAARPRHWSTPVEEVELLDMIGLIQNLLERLRPGLDTVREAASPPGLHPGQAARWRTSEGRTLAWAGRLHPNLQERLDLGVLVAEVDLAAVAGLPRSDRRYVPIPRLTEVTRDLAVVVAAGIDYRSIVETLAGVDSPAAVTFEAIDRYEGQPLAAGESSLTVRVRLQPDKETLTDLEIEAYRAALIASLDRELGLRIRGK